MRLNNEVKKFTKLRDPALQSHAKDWIKILAFTIAGVTRVSQWTNPNIRMSVLDQLNTSQCENQIDQTDYK